MAVRIRIPPKSCAANLIGLGTRPPIIAFVTTRTLLFDHILMSSSKTLQDYAVGENPNLRTIESDRQQP
jgi:hypothetical protein